MILLLRMHSRAHCQARFAASSPYNGFVPCGIRSGSTSIFPPTYSFKHSNQCFVRTKYTLPSGLKFPPSEYLICTIVKALRGGRRETQPPRELWQTKHFKALTWDGLVQNFPPKEMLCKLLVLLSSALFWIFFTTKVFVWPDKSR